jgi:hypothetical protein
VNKLFKKIRVWGLLMAMVMCIVLGVPSVLAADAQIARKEGGLQSFPVKGSSTQIYKGALVCVNTSGYLIAGTDTVGNRFVGIAYENVLNSGSDGDKNCRVYTKGVFNLTASGLAQTSVGALAYVTNDGAVALTSSAFLCVGRIVEYISATSCWVDIGQRGVTLDNYAARLITLNCVHDESGAIDYGETHIAGATTGHIYGRGSWINIDDAGIPAAGHILVPFEGGVYADAAVLTNARIVFGAQHQAVLGSSPASLHCWRLNTATRSITALIAAASPQSVGYVANATANSTKLGDIPFADIVGPGVVYIRVYGAQT